MMNCKWFYILALALLPALAQAQKISYAEPDSKDSKSLDFEIIGKVAGNILIYKHIRSNYAVSVYDNDMRLKDRVDMDFIPDKAVNVEFVNYPDYAYVIYQYQKRSILHCMAAKIDGNGKKVGEVIELDTARIPFFADNKIYSTIYSEDRKQIMVYKIQKKNDVLRFTTLLFDPELRLKKKSYIEIAYEERRDVFSDFLVDNEGNFLVTKGYKSASRDLINELTLMVKRNDRDSFQFYPLTLKNIFLDEVKLKVDNLNKHYLVNSFYYKTRRGNVEGLYTAVLDAETGNAIGENLADFSDSLKYDAKSGGSLKLAFNDYFIRNVILRRDGGFILVAEDFYTQSRANPWNRMDYLYGSPYMSNYNYYLGNPSNYYYYYRPRSSLNNLNQTRYYYENIVVMSFDNTGQVEWSNVIHKSQYDDETEAYLSYQLMNAGDELHVLFNELERRNQLIADQSITASGKLIRNPTLKSLDKGYQFMPRFARQVGAKQIILPCTYRNYICFAKIDY